MKEKRAKGQRRWGFMTEYPLIDKDGVVVIANRRKIPDRRLDNITLEERQLLLSEMPNPDRD